MVDPLAGKDEQELWRRWRAAASPASAAEIGPLALAAYAEDRLPVAEIEAVEDWLAEHPEAAADVLAARRVTRQAPSEEVPAAIVARAATLVQAGGAEVVAFRPRAGKWGAAIRWGAMAASIVIASLVGFALGNNTYDTYARLAGGATATLGQELLDPPTGLFNSADEDSGT